MVIGHTGDDLCPVTAILAYLAARGEMALKTIGLDPSKYAGHSFRVGAATTAAAAGLEDSTIKTLGRWESSAYQLYIRIPKHHLKTVSSSLLKINLV